MPRPIPSLVALGFCAVTVLSCSDGPAGMQGEIGTNVNRGDVPVDRPAVTVPAQTEKAAPQLTHQVPHQAFGPVDLEARRELSLGSRPLGVCAADFDGDGFDDLAVAMEKPGELRVYFGAAEGLSTDRETRLSIGDYPIAPVIFGNPPRIAVASSATQELLVIDVTREALTVTGTLSLDQTPRALSPVPNDDQALVLVDRIGGLHSFRIDGATPEETHTVDVGASPVGVLAMADGGVVVLTQSDESLHLFAPNQDGDLIATSVLPFDGIPRSAAEGDLDGDGDLELVILGGDRRVLVFGLGAPAPTTWAENPGPGKKLMQIGLVPMCLSIADLDKDGRAELVSLGQNDQGYSVMGAFDESGPRVSISEYAGQDPWGLALGDFDGNGTKDLAMACRAANAISLLSGKGRVMANKPAFAQARRIAVGTNPLSVAAVDLTGDGRPEVATLDASDGNLSILVNDGFGGLKLADRIPVGPSPRALHATRFQGLNAATELMLLVEPSGGSARLIVFGRKSNGTFGLLEIEGPNGALIPASTDQGLIPQDLDGDGVDDIVMLDLLNRSLSAYKAELKNSGDTLVLTPLGTPIVWDADRQPTAITAILRFDPKVNRKRPFFAVGFPMGIAVIDPLDGTEVSLIPRPRASGPTNLGPARLLTADLDGDGNGDLVALWLGNQGTSPGVCSAHVLDAVLREKASTTVTTGLAPAGFAAGDLNNDGLDDIILAAQNSHNANLWLTDYKDGKLTLKRDNDLGVGLGPLAVICADLLGRGRLDILVVNTFSSDVSVILNRLK